MIFVLSAAHQSMSSASTGFDSAATFSCRVLLRGRYRGSRPVMRWGSSPTHLILGMASARRRPFMMVEALRWRYNDFSGAIMHSGIIHLASHLKISVYKPVKLEIVSNTPSASWKRMLFSRPRKWPRLVSFTFRDEALDLPGFINFISAVAAHFTVSSR